MDDMVFHNNNKNAIYVLNTSYNTYGELGRPNAFGYPQINSDEIYNNSSSPRNCSISRSLHKLKSLRHHSAEKISSAGSRNSTENNSSSTTSCSPAAAALHKLFNCSSAVHSCKSINYKSNNNNNNCHSNSHLHQDLTHHGNSNSNHQKEHLYAHQETGKQQHLEYHHLDNQMPLSFRDDSTSNTASRPTCMLPCVNGGKKKHSISTTSVKSTLIAKKTKFWKYLVEEEKWRKHSVENLSTTNCERDWDSKSIGKSSLSNHSSINDIQTMNTPCGGSRSTQVGLGAINNPSSKSNLRSCTGNSIRISNWSGNADTNTNNNNNEKSSAELYKEAAELLGLSCTLCDNCRCLDCQSRYFECDDSDSYSEFSFMDEYYETLQDVGRNLKDLQSRHCSSSSLRSSQDGTPYDTDDQQMSTDLDKNILDHCDSFNDLKLDENFVESQN